MPASRILDSDGSDKKEEKREWALTLPPGKLHEGAEQYPVRGGEPVIES